MPRRSSHRCRQQTRPSTKTTTSFVDNAIKMPWRNFPKSGVWDKVPHASTLLFGNTKFLYNTVWDRRKEDSVPNTNSIHLVVSIQYHFVTNGRADGRTHDDSKYRAIIASRGKKHEIHVGCAIAITYHARISSHIQ